jgi:hypothetical protein
VLQDRFTASSTGYGQLVALFVLFGGCMDKEQRYQAVQSNIKDLLDLAANDQSTSGMIGLGAAWLAAEMFARNEQTRMQDKRSGYATKEND